jgi:hypothetical protein
MLRKGRECTVTDKHLFSLPYSQSDTRYTDAKESNPMDQPHSISQSSHYTSPSSKIPYIPFQSSSHSLHRDVGTDNHVKPLVVTSALYWRPYARTEVEENITGEREEEASSAR